MNDTRVKVNDFLPEGMGDEWGMKLKGILTVEEDMLFEFGLAVAGRAKMYVDGKLLIDNWDKQKPGEFFYGQGSIEEKASVPLCAGKPVDIEVVYINSSPPLEEGEERDLSQPALMRGLRLGGAEKIDEDSAIKEAVDLAASCDLAVVVCGLTPEWEAEGFDRPTLDLPRRQNELISSISKANSKTVVVVQAGSAVNMQPWVNNVAAILYSWYLGNESGNAIANILFGKVNPCAKLPLTLPVRIEDVPSYLCSGSENGKVFYREDIFVGYKHYQSRKIKPLFAFGHGLSYTSFTLSELKINVSPSGTDFAADILIKVTNTGSVSGSEVVQVYVTLPPNGTATPEGQLRGFTKVRDLSPGSNQIAKVHLDKYAVSFWDTPINKWRVVGSKYVVHVGNSSDNLTLEGSFKITSGFTWSGL